MNKQDRLDQDGAVDPVLFYGRTGEFWIFSNFSPHKVILPNPFTGVDTIYRTVEHRYQAMKATDVDDHDYVVACETPGRSKDAGRSIELREGWGSNYGDLCWYVMVEALTAKYFQNADFWKALRSTTDRHIYEDSPVDDIWGWRYREDYRGKNLLGRALMYVRDNT